jgi:hypothetical protein
MIPSTSLSAEEPSPCRWLLLERDRDREREEEETAAIGQQRRTRSTRAASSKGWPGDYGNSQYPGRLVLVAGQLVKPLCGRAC